MPSDVGYSVVRQDYKNPTNGAAVASACPAGAVGFFVTATTQDARISLDGTAATATNGIHIPAGTGPSFFFPIASDLSVIGLNAAASDVSILWVK